MKNLIGIQPLSTTTTTTTEMIKKKIMQGRRRSKRERRSLSPSLKSSTACSLTSPPTLKLQHKRESYFSACVSVPDPFTRFHITSISKFARGAFHSIISTHIYVHGNELALVSVLMWLYFKVFCLCVFICIAIVSFILLNCLHFWSLPFNLGFFYAPVFLYTFPFPPPLPFLWFSLTLSPVLNHILVRFLFSFFLSSPSPSPHQRTRPPLPSSPMNSSRYPKGPSSFGVLSLALLWSHQKTLSQGGREKGSNTSSFFPLVYGRKSQLTPHSRLNFRTSPSLPFPPPLPPRKKERKKENTRLR